MFFARLLVAVSVALSFPIHPHLPHLPKPILPNIPHPLRPHTIEDVESITLSENYAEAFELSVKQKRPLVCIFGTEGCIWCKRLEGSLRDEQVRNLLFKKNVVLCHVDANRESDIARSLQVTSYPTLTISSPDKTILARHEGYLNPSDMIEFLKAIK